MLYVVSCFQKTRPKNQLNSVQLQIEAHGRISHLGSRAPPPQCIAAERTYAQSDEQGKQPDFRTHTPINSIWKLQNKDVDNFSEVYLANM